MAISSLVKRSERCDGLKISKRRVRDEMGSRSARCIVRRKRGKRILCTSCDENGGGEEEGERGEREKVSSSSSSSSSSSVGTVSESAMTEMAVSAVRFYKAAISPVLPRSCRFVPSCSSYSIEAFERFGFTRGMLLTAWRILRCTPIGGRGYDPPVWPPVGYWYVGIVPPAAIPEERIQETDLEKERDA